MKFKREPDSFYSTLSQRVNKYFDQNDIARGANEKFYFKAATLVAIYLGGYVTLLLYGGNMWVLFSMFALMGSLAILIGLNLGHDAAHGVASPIPRVNALMLLVFDLMGANSNIWRYRHVNEHHHFPNINGKDSDIQQIDLVRIFPDAKLKPFHRFQYLYMPFLYFIYTLNWILVRDFKDQIRISFKSNAKYVVRLIFFKLFFFCYILVIPSLTLDHSFAVILLGFFFMTTMSSMVVFVALVSSHVGRNSEFPIPDKHGDLPYSWSHHQLATTADFATSNPIVNLLFGGFNHHVVHHLFPTICHVHYPALTPILIETAHEFNLPYYSEDNLWQNVKSHFQLLKDRGAAR